MSLYYTGRHREQLYRSLTAHGTHLGFDEWGEVWVLDGTVYLCDALSIDNLGDYFEFCEHRRAGKYPRFTFAQEYPFMCQELVECSAVPKQRYYWHDPAFPLDCNGRHSLVYVLDRSKGYNALPSEFRIVTDPAVLESVNYFVALHRAKYTKKGRRDEEANRQTQA